MAMTRIMNLHIAAFDMAITHLQAMWWLWLGRSRSKREDYGGALTCYERVLRFFPNDLRALANVGNCLHHQERYAEAIDFYDRALQIRADYPDVHARIGAIFCHLQRYQESIDSLSRAFRMKPSLKEDSSFSLTFAISLAYLGKTKDALGAYRAALEQNPRNAWALAGVGWALLELGNFADAELPLRDAIRLEPGLGKAVLHLSFVLGGLKRYDEALVLAERFAALEPENPTAHANVGWFLSETGRQREALIAYKRSVELNPNIAEGYCELGRIHERLGEFQQAIDAEEKALSLDQNPLAFCVMGLALLEQGNHERSIYYSEKATELRSNYYEAWANLGEALLVTGQLEKAVVCFEKVLELAPAIPEIAYVRLQIGTAQLKLGNTEAAQNQYRLLHAMNSDKANELCNAILANGHCKS